MKKIITLLVFVFVIFAFSSCGNKDKTQEQNKQQNIQETQVNQNTQAQTQQKVASDILQQQKEQLPKILTLLKSQKVCLEKATSKEEAIACWNKMIEESKTMWLEWVSFDEEKQKEAEEKLVWDDTEKEKTLTDLDQAITSMQTTVDCISKVNTMEEASKCFMEEE